MYLLLFIIAFAGAAYMLMMNGEQSLQKSMNKTNPTNAQPQRSITSIQREFPQPPAMEINPQKSYTAKIKTNMGDITVNLHAAQTPKTVNNFVFLARKDFYDNTVFHRVIKNFMIQGGDPDGNGTGGPGYAFEDEISPDQVFDKSGILAMANRGPDTNGSQFFITQASTPWLTGKHTIFGHVTKGIDVLSAIAQVQTGNNDKPVKDITITDIEITEQ